NNASQIHGAPPPEALPPELQARTKREAKQNEVSSAPRRNGGEVVEDFPSHGSARFNADPNVGFRRKHRARRPEHHVGEGLVGAHAYRRAGLPIRDADVIIGGFRSEAFPFGGDPL